jgi:hypothetical protein
LMEIRCPLGGVVLDLEGAYFYMRSAAYASDGGLCEAWLKLSHDEARQLRDQLMELYPPGTSGAESADAPKGVPHGENREI